MWGMDSTPGWFLISRIGIPALIFPTHRVNDVKTALKLQACTLTGVEPHEFHCTPRILPCLPKPYIRVMVPNFPQTLWI